MLPFTKHFYLYLFIYTFMFSSLGNQRGRASVYLGEPEARVGDNKSKLFSSFRPFPHSLSPARGFKYLVVLGSHFFPPVSAGTVSFRKYVGVYESQEIQRGSYQWARGVPTVSGELHFIIL